MPSTDRLIEFTAIVQAGSISAASRALDLPRATLSRRMTTLEAELGVRLMHRSTRRRVVLTDAGVELERRARRIVAESEAAWRAVRRLDDVPRGLLRVSATGDMLDDLMVGFLKDFPEVQLEVVSTSRRVDLVGEGVDVAVRFGPVIDPNLIMRRIATSRRVVVGSPDYLGAHGTPHTAEELADHSCLLAYAGDGGTRSTWPTLDGGELRVSGPMTANRSHLTLRAAKAGLGLALLPWLVAYRAVRDGQLVPVLLDSVGTEHPISLVYADREYIEPKVRVFVDRAIPVLKSWFGGVPPVPGAESSSDLGR